MRTTIRKKIAIMLTVAGTMLLLSSGIAFAVQVIDCKSGHVCNDTAFGGIGDDTIIAGGDNDNVNGGTGNDTINAGPGNDTVMANDGQLDSISCGLGTDVVFVDQEDLDAENTNFQDFIRLTSCETINEPEAPQSTE